MGNVCSLGAGESLEIGEFRVPMSLHQLVRLQSAVRGFLAKRRLQRERTTRIRKIMRKLIICSNLLESAITDTTLAVPQGNEKLVEQEMAGMARDGVRRVFID